MKTDDNEGERKPFGIGQLLMQVDLLLGHLQRLPDTRLTRFFEPQRTEAGLSERDPTPPTMNQTYFLSRIAAIADTGAPPGGVGALEEKIKDLEDDRGPQLNDPAFLLWARDFLAALVYPANVDTIRVTRAFQATRMGAFPGLRELKNLMSYNKMTDWDLTLNNYGYRLYKQLRFFYLLTIILVVFSAWTSFMLFTGQVLIRENDTLRAAQEAMIDKIIHAQKEKTAYPDGSAMIYDISELLKYDAVLISGNVNYNYCKSVAVIENRKLAALDEVRLCIEKEKLDKRESELQDLHHRWFKASWPLIFIMVKLPRAIPDIIDYFHRPSERNSSPGQEGGSPLTPNASGSNVQSIQVAQTDLTTLRFEMEQTVNGLIGAVLPVSYACLGALAALFRRLTAKAELETLGPSDYGGMRISLILGVLTGAVVGLFTDFVHAAPSDVAVPLSTTAIALLAGFASDRVFGMFDTLADRVFGRPVTSPTPTPAQHRPGK